MFIAKKVIFKIASIYFIMKLRPIIINCKIEQREYI